MRSATRTIRQRTSTPHRQALNVKAYVACSLSLNTKKAYDADLARFKAWGGSIPSTPQALARYLAEGAATHKPSTLTRQLAAIAHAHNTKGLPSPTSSPLVKSTLRGIRRTHGCSQKQAQPLTPRMLHRLLKPNPSYSTLQNARDRALLLLGFAGGFRRSELSSLRLADIALTRRGVVVRLRSAKTDQFGKGREVAVPCTRNAHCPVQALKRWLRLLQPHLDQLRAAPVPTDIPLFASIDRHGHIRTGLNPASIGWILMRRMRAAGMQTAGFSAHSLRAGLVTSAAKAGVPIWAIQRQTGHRSDLTVQRYIRNLGAFECNAASGLL